jgi:tRNA threonylcarbamoyl adenosine modification protein (Sua5/YciO/YrdC/YwlC family)
MAQFFQIHPDNPQVRLLRRAVEIVREGGLLVYPTDSCYAIGCCIGDKAAMERLRRVRKLDDRHNLTLVCRDLSEIASYAKIGNQSYRLLRNLTPGPYTFIHKATKQVPRRLQHPRRKTIGIRVPGNKIAQTLLSELGEPMMSSTLILPGEDLPLTDPHEIRQALDRAVDLVIDGGYCGLEATTVVDMVNDVPSVVRVGKGDVSLFEGKE